MTSTMTAISRTVPCTFSRSRTPTSRDEHLPDARQLEDPLDHHDTGDEAGDLHAEDRDDRHRRVAQPVTTQRLCPGQALRPGRADVVLVQHVERRRADEAQEHGALREGQGDRRQDERRGSLGRIVPSLAREALCRQEVPLDGEDDDQHQPDPERRHGDAELAGHREPTPSARRWREPATTPSGTATTTDSTVEASTSGAVTVSFSPSSLVTVSPLSADVPKSPCRMPLIQSKYCATSDRSRPSSSRIASIRSGVASVPPTTRARSPGSSRSSRKTMMLVTKKATSSSGHEQRRSLRHERRCAADAHPRLTVMPEASNRDAVSSVG